MSHPPQARTTHHRHTHSCPAAPRWISVMAAALTVAAIPAIAPPVTPNDIRVVTATEVALVVVYQSVKPLSGNHVGSSVAKGNTTVIAVVSPSATLWVVGRSLGRRWTSCRTCPPVHPRRRSMARSQVGHPSQPRSGTPRPPRHLHDGGRPSCRITCRGHHVVHRVQARHHHRAGGRARNRRCLRRHQDRQQGRADHHPARHAPRKEVVALGSSVRSPRPSPRASPEATQQLPHRPQPAVPLKGPAAKPARLRTATSYLTRTTVDLDSEQKTCGRQ
jgi:hypothetical protein